MTSPAYERAWRAMSQTRDQEIAPRPELPPRDLQRRPTSKWLPAIVFCGQPVRFSADRPLPANCQHAMACAMEAVESDVTLDLGPSDWRTP